MNESNQLPTFLIIGAMKAGTTSLHYYLSKHPDVFMSEQKELDFFIAEKNLTKGLEWYKEQFPTGAIAVGESSPNYTKSLIFDGVPERIKDIIPDVKLIYILREPVNRLISHYSHQFIDRKELRSIDEVVIDLQTNHYVDSSLYGKQLKYYLNYFDRSKILILRSEDLEAQPLETLHEIFNFIGVDAAKFVFNTIRSHQTSDKRRLTNVGHRIAKWPMGLRICSMFSSICWETIITPKLSDQNMKLLKAYFKSDLQLLNEIAGKEIYPA